MGNMFQLVTLEQRLIMRIDGVKITSTPEKEEYRQGEMLEVS
jgi:hypothetical protein